MSHCIQNLANACAVPDILSDMKGYKYTVGTVLYLPFVWKLDGAYKGIDIDMSNYLAERNNFRYNCSNSS